MATKNNPGKFDCYANADPDEPMFVLLARDKHAVALIWLWCTLRELDNEDPTKVADARACADEMVAWAVEHKRKVCGMGHAGLAAMLELVRMANYAVKNAKNEPTSNEEAMRFFLALTTFDLGDEPKP